MPDLPNIDYLRQRAEPKMNWDEVAGRVYKYATGQIEGTSIHSVRQALERLPEIMYNPNPELLPELAMELAGLALGGSVGVGGLGAGPRLPKGFYSPLVEALKSGKLGKFDLGKNPKAASLLSVLRKGGITEDELGMTGFGNLLMRKGQDRIPLEHLAEYAQNAYPNFTIYRRKEGIGRVSRILSDQLDKLDYRFNRFIEAGDHRGARETQELIQKTERKLHALDLPRYESYSTVGGRLSNDPLDLQLDDIAWLEGDEAVAAESPGTLDVPKQPVNYEERLLNLSDAQQYYRSPHWSGEAMTNQLGHTRLSDLRLINPVSERPTGARVTHIDEVQSDWNIGISKERATPGTPHSFVDMREYDRKNYVLKQAQERLDQIEAEGNQRIPSDVDLDFEQEFVNRRRKAQEDVLNARRQFDYAMVTPPIRSGNIERTLVRDVVRRSWEKGSEGITWTTAEGQAERYGKLVDEVRWEPASDTGGEYNPTSPDWQTGKVLDVYATDASGRESVVGTYHIDDPELPTVIGQAAARAMREKPEGVLSGRQMFRSENYVKTYDKLLPRIFKEEYGVTPEKRKIWSDEFGREIDVWYVPLTEEMKKKAFAGQPFAFADSIIGRG